MTGRPVIRPTSDRQALRNSAAAAHALRDGRDYYICGCGHEGELVEVGPGMFGVKCVDGGVAGDCEACGAPLSSQVTRPLRDERARNQVDERGKGGR